MIYRIPVTYMMSQVLTIEANTLIDAIHEAASSEAPLAGSYLDDSWQVDVEGARDNDDEDNARS